MKNWIDRMAFNNHRPAFAGKSAVIVTTSGMGSTSHTQKTMQYALMAWGIHVSFARMLGKIVYLYSQ
jgi:multimeric flavodoxin WrbA